MFNNIGAASAKLWAEQLILRSLAMAMLKSFRHAINKINPEISEEMEKIFMKDLIENFQKYSNTDSPTLYEELLGDSAEKTIKRLFENDDTLPDNSGA